MLLHPSIQQLMTQLGAAHIPGNPVLTTPSSQSGQVGDSLYSAVHYGWQSLLTYQEGTRNKVMEVGGGSIRMHAVSSGCIEVDFHNPKLLALYLVQNHRDLFESLPANYPPEELVDSVAQFLTSGDLSMDALMAFAHKHPDVKLQKVANTTALARLINQYQTLRDNTLRPAKEAPAEDPVLHHLFYNRGVRGWAAFLTVGTAQYSLFFHTTKT